MSSLQVMRRISSVLLGIVLLLIGVALVGILYNQPDLTRLAEAIQGLETWGRTAIWGLALLSVLLGLLWMLASVIGSPVAQLETSTESGRIIIQTSTAQDFVRECASEVSGVLEARCPTIVQKGGSIRIEVVLAPNFSEPVHTLAETVQRRIHDEVQRVFGLENIQEVDVRIVSPPKRSGVPMRARKATPMDDITRDEPESFN